MQQEPANHRSEEHDVPIEIPFRARWITPSGFSSLDLDCGGVAPLPETLGHENLDFIPLGNGSGIFTYQGILESQVKVLGEVASDEPYIILRIITNGAARTSIHDLPARDETTESYGIYLHPGRTGCSIENMPQYSHSLVGPMLSLTTLQNMLEGEKAPLELSSFLSGSPEHFVAHPRTTPIIRRLSEDLRICPYTGSMRSLYLQGKMFELMAQVICDLSGTQPGLARTVSDDLRKAKMARDILMVDLGNPPTVEAVARQVGLSQRRLNEVFRDSFEGTVIQCLGRWRAELAESLLVGGELPIKQIAHQLGYSHVNNFIAAFTRQFGVPPAQRRREMR